MRYQAAKGVRGAKYAFVNSNRLQAKLKELDISYRHLRDLAPTTEIRNLQKEVDARQGELKRERIELGQVFKIAYKDRILNHFNFDEFIENLEQYGASKIVLFCVEEKSEACHRSIVTEKITTMGYKITHL